jgi:hypothetical protein
MLKFDQEYVRDVVDAVSQNPKGFLKLAAQLCKTVSQDEIKRSMRAWNIDPNKETIPSFNDEDTVNWSSGSR